MSYHLNELYKRIFNGGMSKIITTKPVLLILSDIANLIKV